MPLLFYCVGFSPSMAVKILEAYEGTLEEDSPPDNERYEHSEMLLYKVTCGIIPVPLQYMYSVAARVKWIQQIS